MARSREMMVAVLAAVMMMVAVVMVVMVFVVRHDPHPYIVRCILRYR